MSSFFASCYACYIRDSTTYRELRLRFCRLNIASHSCPANERGAGGKLFQYRELFAILMLPRSEMQAGAIPSLTPPATRMGEPRPNHLLSIDQLPSRPRVSPLRGALQRRWTTAWFFLFGSVLGDGIRATDLSRQPARHRSLSARPGLRQTWPE